MYRLLENKNHLIDRLNLTPDQKEEVKAFFAKHPGYESKIDWNNKSLQYKDFEPLLILDGKSKTQVKKNGLRGLVDNKDYVDFGEADIPELGDCHIYQPLSYLGSKALASNNVPPVKGNGAKWCISYQKTDEYWRDYTKKGIKFLFVFTGDTKYALTIYPESLHYENEVYTFEDKNVGWPSWCRSPEIIECISNLREIPGPSLAELLSKYKGTLIKNPDGTIDKVGYEKVDLSDFIRDNHFICQFNKWKGDFICNDCGLVSLKGVPREVGGNFFCSLNNLTSLKGAPREVGGGFYCGSNNLVSLEGTPEKIMGGFNCSYNKKLTTLKGAPREVEKFFNCCWNNLTSLEGAPEKVGGGFNCNYNNLTSLEGAPREVGKYFECEFNDLVSLKGAPEKVGGDFNCSFNKKLASLKGAPKEVEDAFYCRDNDLTSLEGAPEKVGGDFNCAHNKLTLLKGSPKEVGGYFDCRRNHLTSLEGAPEKIGRHFYYDDYLKK